MQAQRTGRGPSEISEGAAERDGIVVVQDPYRGDARWIDHSVFYQRWDPPAGTYGNDLVVISPAYLTTARFWTDVCDVVSRSGRTTLAMDHEYAGYTKGKAGRCDGASLAAAAALMLCEAEALRRHEKKTGSITLVGEGLGATAILCGAILLYNGRIKIPRAAIPKGAVRVALVNPEARTPLWPRVASGDQRLAQIDDVRAHPSSVFAAHAISERVLKDLEDGRLKIPQNLCFDALLDDKHPTSVRLLDALGPHLTSERTLRADDRAQVHEAVAALATRKLAANTDR
jgi:hypothetical protein